MKFNAGFQPAFLFQNGGPEAKTKGEAARGFGVQRLSCHGSVRRNEEGVTMVNPLHVSEPGGERLVFPDGAIELVIKIPGAATGGAFAVFEDLVRPGAGPVRHVHRDQAETFFVLDGQFDIEIEGILIHAGPGDIAFVPKGAVHAFKNVGADHGRLRFMFTPAGESEAMFRAFLAAAHKRPLTVETMNGIAMNYGQTFVGPPL